MSRFHGTFTEADLISAATVSVISGQFMKLGEYKVLAGEMVSLGYGLEGSMADAIGRVFALVKDGESTPVEIKGTYRFMLEDPQGMPIRPLGDYRSEQMNTSATDRTKQYPFPLSAVRVSQDKKIALYFKADRTATLTKANCTIAMDITRDSLAL